MLKKVEIYQLKNNETEYAFQSWNKAVNSFNRSDYESVISLLEQGEDLKICKTLFDASNTDADSRLAEVRTLSVSDVVVIGGTRAYYIDEDSFIDISSRWFRYKNITIYTKNSKGDLLEPSDVILWETEVLADYAARNLKPGDVIETKTPKGLTIFYEVLANEPGINNLHEIGIPTDCWINGKIKTNNYMEPETDQKVEFDPIPSDSKSKSSDEADKELEKIITTFSTLISSLKGAKFEANLGSIELRVRVKDKEVEFTLKDLDYRSEI